MKKILLLVVMFALMGSVQACSNKSPDLKSPCTGIEGSPCGPKRPANAWLS